MSSGDNSNVNEALQLANFANSHVHYPTFNILNPPNLPRVAPRNKSVAQKIRAYEERLDTPIIDNAAQKDCENQSSFSESTTCFRKQSVKVKLLICGVVLIIAVTIGITTYIQTTTTESELGESET